jgi:hypothetical protein
LEKANSDVDCFLNYECVVHQEYAWKGQTVKSFIFSSFSMMQCIINGFESDIALSGSNYSIPLHLLTQHNLFGSF